MSKSKWFTATATALILSTSLAFAGDGKPGRHRGEAFGGRIAQELNLTDAQKQQIRDLNQSFREQNKAFFEQARQTKLEYRDAKKANDTAKMESLKPVLEAQRAQMKQLREASNQRLMSVLTPEQRQQFDALKAQRQGRHKSKDR